MPASPFAAGTLNIGSDFTSEELYRSLYAGLYSAAVMPNIPGIQRATSNGLPLRIPKLGLADVTASDWHGENEAIAISQGSSASVTLLPASLKSIKIAYQASHEVVQSSVHAGGGGLDATLAKALQLRVAAAVDSALIGGSGAGNTILGLANRTGIGAIDAAGPLSVDDIFDAEITIRGAGGNPTAIVMSPGVYGSVRKLKTTQGAYLVEPDVTAGQFGTIGGLNIYITPHAPAGTVLVFDPAFVMVATSKAGTVDYSEDALFLLDAVAFRVVARWDIAPIYNEAVVKITGITP